MIPYYDIHAHLADSRIIAKADAIVAASVAQGVRGILVNAARAEEWPTVVQLIRHPEVYGALGLHPFFVDAWKAAPRSLGAQLKTAIIEAGPRLRAVGEIGLDFQNGKGAMTRQIAILEEQLAVAAELGLPVIVHNRKSWPEFFAVWKSTGHAVPHGVCHHFTGSRDIARQALDLGLFVAFCGPLTYPNARRLKDAAIFVPLDRILTETDAPDLPPESYRGGFSYPWHVQAVVAELARLKQLSAETVAVQVEANFRRILDLPEAGWHAP